MKKSIVVCLSLVFILLLSACNTNTSESVTKDEVDANNTVREEVLELEEADDSSYEDLKYDVPMVELSEDDILDTYESTVEIGEYELAGNTLYVWLKEHDSDRVQERLNYLKEHMYVSECLSTTYDHDYVTSTVRYKYNERGDLISEEYGADSENTILYSYQYIYEGDTCTSETYYDSDGDIVYIWEATLNDDGYIVSETEAYNNLEIVNTFEHDYNDNYQCIKEYAYYLDESGVTNEEWVSYEYEDDLIVKETHLNSEMEVIEEVLYKYDDICNMVSAVYYDGNNNEEMSIVYEYDERGNMLKESLINGTHEESYVYTYDKFNNNITKDFYIHDTLNESIKYTYDFLGNVIITNSELDNIAIVNDLYYIFK